MIRSAVVLAFAALLAAASWAQAGGDADRYAELVGKLIELRTAGGGHFRGILFSAVGDRVEIASPEGVITGIARDSIASLEPIDPARDPAEYFQDSAANRLILMPTGFAMDPGEFHVAAQEIVAITASYGITAHVSTWAGVSFPGAVLNLRWSASLGSRKALSLGALGGYSWLADAGLALPYAILSFGHENRNLTLGAGLPVAWWIDRPLHPAGLVGTVAGKIIVSPTTSIVTENWIVAVSDDWSWSRLEGYAFPAAVFRIAGDRFSWDIGAAVPLIVGREGGAFVEGLADGTVIPIPILSVTYRIE